MKPQDVVVSMSREQISKADIDTTAIEVIAENPASSVQRRRLASHRFVEPIPLHNQALLRRV